MVGLQTGGLTSEFKLCEGLEAAIGIEPMNKGFAGLFSNALILFVYTLDVAADTPKPRRMLR
jgi:hypothetical protein